MSDQNSIAPKWLILLLNILLCLSLAKSQPNCLDSETYADNSTYQANLNTLISSLSPNIGPSGFYNASIGQSPDQISAIVLCRGDITLTACRQCIDATAPELVRRCVNNRAAIFWNETCMIRFSDQPIFGILQTEPVSPNPSTSRVMNPREHGRQLRALLESLREHAANGDSVQKVAAGNRSTPDTQAVFALEQCTPDISARDCRECLTRAINDIPTCCSGIIGAGILRPSCTLRFENYRFFSASIFQFPQEPLGSGNGSNRTAVIVGVSVAVVVCVILAISAIFLLRKRMKRKTKENVDTPDETSTAESLQYDFGKIRAATNDFSDANKLGQGGFGAVYKGELSNGQEMAVKRLSKDSGQGNMEFKNEVLLVARLQHRNLVRLLGFSIEGTERLLIYEYVQNASLDQFIFDPRKSSSLDWGRRYKIIGGIARGLLYLHEDSRLRIIHRDLKASNVLLDGEMNPKIADFGMARLFGQDETQGNTNRIVGTYGYMSPEYAMHGQFSVKSDVFSFGVLVLEIMSGRKSSFIGENAEDLVSFTWKNWREGKPDNVIDPVLGAGPGSLRDMLRCIHIGLLCVQENPADRPTMASIVLMLNSSTITLPVASEPAFFMASRFGPKESISIESDSSKASKFKGDVSEGLSQNDMSVTELYPR